MKALFDAIVEQLSNTFDVDRIAEWVASALPKLIAAIAIFVAFYVIWRFVRAALGFVLKKADVDKTISQFVLTVSQYVLLTIATLMILSQLGVDTASLIASLGVVGLTIGFAAKDALSNIMSGLFIFWDRPFTVDDLVEINGAYGRVENITLRSTRIVTPDGKMLAFPNTMIVNSTVASYTNFPTFRLDVEVTIAVTSNISEVREVLLGMIATHPEYMTTPEPRVEVKALNDYNVLLEVRVWIENEREHVASRFGLREQIFNVLNEAGVEMPYETIQLAPFTMKGELPKGDKA